MNQLGFMGTTYTSEGQPGGLAGCGGQCKGTGEAGQNLVAPGLSSVTNKPSKSVFSFIASRKALSINVPSHQILAEYRQRPGTATHSLSHLQAFALSVPSARIPSCHPLARPLASLTENSFNGQVPRVSCLLQGSWYLGQRPTHSGAQKMFKEYMNE